MNTKKKIIGLSVGALVVLPFIYLTSLSLLLSAHVHGWSIPSRAFLSAYASPSNVITDVPGVGSVYSTYFEFCVKLTKADYMPEHHDA
jgi:hypothetical protein